MQLIADFHSQLNHSGKSLVSPLNRIFIIDKPNFILHVFNHNKAWTVSINSTYNLYTNTE